ncbi:MAG: preprotein translocase subunit SecG [Chitinophagales bacterium]|jgi:preprotein translocase subunit SecG|nr:preprotein translocase subunit SecG [Chitinophagales bacterium]
MYSFITILIIIACVLLMLVVLIQNPKGGGLSSTFGGISNQILGVKRTTDFLEKATWTLIVAIAVLSISTFLFSGSSTTPIGPKSELEDVDLGGAPAAPLIPPGPATAPDTSGIAR